jgi:FkbM family methyltransferase
MIPKSSVVATGPLSYIIFDTDDVITKSIRSNGYWEEDVANMSRPLLKGLESGIVLDIGANLGSYSIPLAHEYRHLTFHAFELQRIIFYQLCGNVFINGLENVFTHNCGISDRCEDVRVNMPDYSLEANIGAFSLNQEVIEKNNYLSSVGNLETVSIKTLDEYGFTDVRLIKIDVEGLEIEVLQGAIQTIKNNDYPPIVFEAWDHIHWYMQKREKLFDFIKSMGYQIQEFGENNLAQHKSRPAI